jgi:hypothetical protein
LWRAQLAGDLRGGRNPQYLDKEAAIQVGLEKFSGGNSGHSAIFPNHEDIVGFASLFNQVTHSLLQSL